MSDSYDIAATELRDREAAQRENILRDWMRYGPLPDVRQIRCLGCRQLFPQDVAHIVHSSQLPTPTGFCFESCVTLALHHEEQDANDYPPKEY